jgi:hypothetical protein
MRLRTHLLVGFRRSSLHGLGAKYVDPFILVAAIGEGLLTLWLLVMGVNAEAWKEQAAANGE